MDTLKPVLKFAVASTLIISGILVAGTIFAAKKIDQLGDDLDQKIHE
ncbi:hypothetical protein [Periweissella beninensis]|uniref:Uncharacterized protein n=1 Tax=Periweissella beninensis TaxID=504936 RepID=A0ABT0VIX8_9LACO|nr:hypothetical protein [Periweissella beninensis]MBM7544287.1 hypothetical protein [Periweissella beninensis]MCM2437788.1 hypothetical protein [Periweissella beninensis]